MSGSVNVVVWRVANAGKIQVQGKSTGIPFAVQVMGAAEQRQCGQQDRR